MKYILVSLVVFIGLSLDVLFMVSRVFFFHFCYSYLFKIKTMVFLLCILLVFLCLFCNNGGGLPTLSYCLGIQSAKINSMWCWGRPFCYRSLVPNRSEFSINCSGIVEIVICVLDDWCACSISYRWILVHVFPFWTFP